MTTPRRHRAIAIVVACVLVAGGGTLAAIALRHRSATRDTVAPTTRTDATVAPRFVGKMGVIAPGIGWAMSSSALYRTVDDGAHWRDITPPGTGDPLRHVDALEFLDAEHAWVAVSHAARVFTIWRTVDGGRSWRPARDSYCASSATDHKPRCGFPASIDFIDANHGWSLSAIDRSRGTLLATRDGGNTWTLASRTHFTGPLHFVDVRNAWAVSNPHDFDATGQAGLPGGAIYRTTNGGATWHTVELPTGNAIGGLPLGVGTPQFFGRDGIVAARLVLRPSQVRSIVVYVSRDAGRTWITRPAPPDITVRFVTLADNRFSASSASDWAVLVDTHLYVTRDAGLHWTKVTPTGARLIDVALATPSSGWALVLTPGCATEPLDTCPDALLLHTNDGAHTWLPI